jgi:hypothetical protein
MNIWIRVVSGIIGFTVQIAVFDAAIRTFLLPRVASVRLSRIVSKLMRGIFTILARPSKSYPTRDRILSLYPSLVLLSFQALWMSMSLVAFAFGYVAAGASNFGVAFHTSSTALFTPGHVAPHVRGLPALEALETGVGLTLLALLIAFIPTLYGAFQRREISVGRLSVRAGIPATPWGVLELAKSVESFERLDELWREWEQWFIDVGETHTTLTILNYYRSPSAQQTWIGCAASVLDAAALFNAAVDAQPSPTAGLCIRSGWLTLRKLADFYRVPYPVVLNKFVPISISREEFDLVLLRLERVGVPIVTDHEAAWQDFAGWRMNYDAIIESFYHLFTCPRTDWHSATVQPLFGPSNKRGGEPTIA